MDAKQIRKAYLDFFVERGHQVIPRALLVPQNDPTTLFTGSGMQPLIPYLLGEPHQNGTRLTDSQACLRAQDIEEVGDNRHTTFFEMLGNWSLGDYFKTEQINWFWEFLTEKVGLDPSRIYVTCFGGYDSLGIPKDIEAAAVWKDVFSKAGIDATEVEIGSEACGYAVGEQGGRIFFYDDKNWWCRGGKAADMPPGEPGGPDRALAHVKHRSRFGLRNHTGKFAGLALTMFKGRQFLRHNCPLAFVQVTALQVERNHIRGRVVAFVGRKPRLNTHFEASEITITSV